jgi:cytochrome b
MERTRIWDIPVRLFHWLLAGSFIGAFVIANVVGDDGAAFPIHMLLGGVMVFIVALRIVWGFVGSRWARFHSFPARPSELLDYARGIVAGEDNRYAGHNPGSGIAAFVMFALVFGLAGTGVMMSRGEVFEEIHEVLAWAMVAVVAVHVAGIALHTIRHRENIALSMVDGKKQAPSGAAIRSARPVAGLLFLVLTGFWTAGLIDGYDRQASQITLPVTGHTIQLGEADEHDDKALNGFGRYVHRAEHLVAERWRSVWAHAVPLTVLWPDSPD